MDLRGIERLWKSRENILLILRLRNYEVKKSDDMTIEQFVEWADEMGFCDKIQDMTLSYSKKDGQRIKVYWPSEPKLGGSEYRTISSDMESENLRHAIIVIRDSVTPHAQTTLRYLISQKIYINVFKMDELQINIFIHEKVPEHTVCTSAEKKALMSCYKIVPSQIPKLRLTDPVVRRLGAIRGELIQIKEESDTMPGYYVLSYRLVG